MKKSLLIPSLLTLTLAATAMAAPKAHHHSKRHPAHHSAKISHAQQQLVNINTADAKAIARLAGISKHKAMAIVAYRKRHGKFKSLEALTAVKGMNDKIIKANKAKIAI